MTRAPADEQWIDEAKSYVGFDVDDEVRLRLFGERMGRRFPGVIEHFYDVIQQYPNAAAVLVDGAQVERLKCTLGDWLDSGLAGPHDAAWFAARARIGRRHVEVGLPDRYMFTATNLIRADLKELVREGWSGDEAFALARSIDRWLDLELAIMVHTYQEDSERRLIDRERDQQADRLAAVQRLSAGLAHEVRNPLNAAQLQLQLLARRLKRAGAEEGLLEVTSLVDTEIRRLSQLLQEFLDFARPAQLAAVEADVVAIARQVADLTGVAAQQRGVAVQLAGDTAAVIACDPGKIHQIIHNLVVNAIDAARTRVVITIRVTAEGVVLVVHDDGPGIPDAVLPRLYEPFFSTKEGGTGMGLSITYSLVSLHGGTIDARNAGGAQFTVTLPRLPSTIAADVRTDGREG